MESIRRDDYGFFGPDSPSWKVWASPTALIGFQRAVVLEHFDPFLAAAVADSAGIYTDPSGRLDRTLAYFLTVAVADGRTAIEVSDALMRIQRGRRGSSRSPGRATAPTTRTRSCGSTSPAGIRCSSATSSTGPDRCHRRRSRGSGRSRASPPSCRPASRRTFPRHATRCGSTSPMFAAGYAPPNTPTAQCITCCDTPRDRGVRLWAGSRVLAPAAIATLPIWMRHMGNFDQPAVVDAAVTPIARAWVRTLSANNFRPMLAVARRIAPETAEVLAQHLTADPPLRQMTITPAEARERLAAHA